MSRIGLSKVFRFEAAHQLPNYVGKCATMHGHSYRLRVTVSGSLDALDQAGILLDFGKLSAAVGTCVLDKYDHQTLNEFFPRPTAEVMVAAIFADLAAWFSDEPVLVHSCELWETENCSAIYPLPG